MKNKSTGKPKELTKRQQGYIDRRKKFHTNIKKGLTVIGAGTAASMAGLYIYGQGGLEGIDRQRRLLKGDSRARVGIFKTLYGNSWEDLPRYIKYKFINTRKDFRQSAM